MVRKLIWMKLVLLFLFSGCTFFMRTNPYVDLESSRRAKTGTVGTTTQQIDGALTIERAIEIALANNPEAMAQEHETEALRYQRKVAASQFWPNVQISGGYDHYLQSRRVTAATQNGESGVFSRDILAADVVVSVPLFTGGRIINQVRAADLLQRASEHQLVRTQDELVFNVSSIFNNILAQTRVIESLEFAFKVLEEHLNRVEDLISAQKSAKVDKLRTEVRLSDLEQRLIRERNLLEIQDRVLMSLLGFEQLEESINPEGELTIAVTEIPDFNEALAQAFEKRPDYLAARSKLEAQARKVDIARSDAWPTIPVKGYYGIRWPIGDVTPPSEADEYTEIGGLGVYLDIPLFRGGRTFSLIRQEKEHLYSDQERLRKLELQIQLDIEIALANIESATERVKTTETAVAQAKESMRIEREKYDLGKGAIVDVLDAQAALVQSETNYTAALSDLAIAHVSLKLSTGTI